MQRSPLETTNSCATSLTCTAGHLATKSKYRKCHAKNGTLLY